MRMYAHVGTAAESTTIAGDRHRVGAPFPGSLNPLENRRSHGFRGRSQVRGLATDQPADEATPPAPPDMWRRRSSSTIPLGVACPDRLPPRSPVNRTRVLLLSTLLVAACDSDTDESTLGPGGSGKADDADTDADADTDDEDGSDAGADRVAFETHFFTTAGATFVDATLIVAFRNDMDPIVYGVLPHDVSTDDVPELSHEFMGQRTYSYGGGTLLTIPACRNRGTNPHHPELR